AGPAMLAPDTSTFRDMGAPRAVIVSDRHRKVYGRNSYSASERERHGRTRGGGPVVAGPGPPEAGAEAADQPGPDRRRRDRAGRPGRVGRGVDAADRRRARGDEDVALPLRAGQGRAAGPDAGSCLRARPRTRRPRTRRGPTRRGGVGLAAGATVLGARDARRAGGPSVG